MAEIGAMRDYQRSRVNKATKAFADEVRMGRDSKFRTQIALHDYISDLFYSAWYKNRWKAITSFVVYGDDATYNIVAFYNKYNGKVTLHAGKDKNEVYLLHEIAHVVVENRSLEALHGREFCKRFLALVGRQIGRDGWEILKDKYKLYNVKHRGSDQDWLARVNRRKEKKSMLASCDGSILRIKNMEMEETI